MKPSKTCLIVAILIVIFGFSYASHAFKKIGSTTSTLCYNRVNTCVPTIALIINQSSCPGPISYGVTSASNPIDSESCDITSPMVFCCATLVATLEVPCSPIITPSGLPTGRYKIDNVFCKVLP